MFDPPACSPHDAADALHRQAALVHGLARDLEEAAELLPRAGATGEWWGPAREAVQVALDIERERLRREALRLDGVVMQLRYEAGAAGGAGAGAGAGVSGP